MDMFSHRDTRVTSSAPIKFPDVNVRSFSQVALAIPALGFTLFMAFASGSGVLNAAGKRRCTSITHGFGKRTIRITTDDQQVRKCESAVLKVANELLQFFHHSSVTTTHAIGSNLGFDLAFGSITPDNGRQECLGLTSSAKRRPLVALEVPAGGFPRRPSSARRRRRSRTRDILVTEER